MIRRLHILFFAWMMLGISNSYSQTIDPCFADFKKYSFHQRFEPVFKVSGTAFITKKNISFKLNSTGRKPMFCRMEDNISSRYNFIFQLRTGSDENYRSLAFPKKVEKRSKYLE